MPMKFTCDFPRTRSMCIKLEGLYSFLLGSSLGSHDLTWECPVSKGYSGFRITRTQRKAGDYYREPYPLYIELLYPHFTSTPKLQVQMSADDYLAFLLIIEKEIKEQYAVKLPIFNTGKY